MKKSCFWFFVLAMCSLAANLVVNPPVSAQTSYGSISGAVTDTSGAAVSDAQVTLTNLLTGEKHSQPTGSDGLYSFVSLNPGRYRLEVEKTGFKAVVRTGINLEVGQDAVVSLRLELGEIAQAVTGLSAAKSRKGGFAFGSLWRGLGSKRAASSSQLNAAMRTSNA